jgi:hypothetical protein
VAQGACPGTKKRVITLRKTLFPQTSRSALEEIKLKARPILLCTALIATDHHYIVKERDSSKQLIGSRACWELFAEGSLPSCWGAGNLPYCFFCGPG